MDIEKHIKELNLFDLDKNEAECIVYAWLLKTKLYLISETSQEWSEIGINTLKHELSLVCEEFGQRG